MKFLGRFFPSASTPGSVQYFFSRLAFGVSVFLLIPLTAMQFTEEVDWKVGDFIVAWTILVGAGMTYKLISRNLDTSAFRYGVGLAVGASLALIWINLAVGIIGSEDHPANIMYFGVVMIGFTGIILSQFQPKGLAITAFVMASAQFMVPVIAMLIWKPEITFGVIKVFILNWCFVMLYVGSGLMFRRSVKERA